MRRGVRLGLGVQRVDTQEGKQRGRVSRPLIPRDPAGTTLENMYYFSELALTLNENEGWRPRTAACGRTSGSWRRATGTRPTRRSSGWRRSSASTAPAAGGLLPGLRGGRR